MKKITLQACMFAALCLAISCGGSESKTENDTTQTTETVTKESPAAAPADNTAMNDKKDTMSMDGDMQFANDAAIAGMTEIETGNMATKMGEAKQVKDFGKMMVADHTKASNELKSIAAKKNMTLPSAPDDMHQQHIDMLKDKKGKEFDKAYIDMMTDGHEAVVAKFQNEADNGKDADLKAFAAKTLPTLKMHLEKVKALQASMK